MAGPSLRVRGEHLGVCLKKLARALGVSADRIEELLVGDGGTPRSQPPPAVLPRQLPVATAGFTGRAAELRALTLMLDQAGAGEPGTVVISAIGGTAGVSKTALALYWTHHVAGRFGDGQLHVNLRGFDPAGTPVSPAEVLSSSVANLLSASAQDW